MTAMAVVQAGLSWSMDRTSKTAMLAVPASLSWQLYQHDCLASCTNRTTGDIVTLVLSFTTAFKVSLTFSILL
jgi:hypothetical protein